MLDVLALVVLTVVAGANVWIIRTLGTRDADTRRIVAEAMEETVKRQDDRIRKRVTRTEGTEVGQVPDMPEASSSGIRAGVPIRRPQ